MSHMNEPTNTEHDPWSHAPLIERPCFHCGDLGVVYEDDGALYCEPCFERLFITGKEA